MALDRRTYEEKRDYIRVAVDCDIGLVKQQGGKHFLARGRNLSAAGVAFSTDEPLAPGDVLDMHIEARQALLSVLDATIKVLRVEPEGDGRWCTAGCAITRMHTLQAPDDPVRH